MKWLRLKARFVGRCLGKHLNSNEEGLGDFLGSIGPSGRWQDQNVVEKINIGLKKV